MDNCNCDGSGPHHAGTVRLLPSGGGNLILCRHCFVSEIRWRKVRNLELSAESAYDLPLWIESEVYGGAQ